jgi:hypothetical protein
MNEISAFQDVTVQKKKLLQQINRIFYKHLQQFVIRFFHPYSFW